MNMKYHPLTCCFKLCSLFFLPSTCYSLVNYPSYLHWSIFFWCLLVIKLSNRSQRSHVITCSLQYGDLWALFVFICSKRRKRNTADLGLTMKTINIMQVFSFFTLLSAGLCERRHNGKSWVWYIQVFKICINEHIYCIHSILQSLSFFSLQAENGWGIANIP